MAMVKIKDRYWIFATILLTVWACNLPTQTTQAGESKKEDAWTWLEFTLPQFVEPTSSTPDLEVDPFMQSVNEAIATQFSIDAHPDTFACREEQGDMVSYLDSFPPAPDPNQNSLVKKSFEFVLKETMPDVALMVIDPFSDDVPPIAAFQMDWKLDTWILSPYIRTYPDGTTELVSYIDLEGFEEGDGIGYLFENGYFYGILKMRSKNREDGKIVGEREYQYFGLGMYHQEHKNMLLCMNWSDFSDELKIDINYVAVNELEQWCVSNQLNYFVCSAAP